MKEYNGKDSLLGKKMEKIWLVILESKPGELELLSLLRSNESLAPNTMLGPRSLSFILHFRN